MSHTYRLFEDRQDLEKETWLHLAGENAHIVQRVLRLRVGSRLEILDGKGGVATAVLHQTGTEVVFRLVDVQKKEMKNPTLGLLQGLAKPDRSDWIVQKATELGVDQIVFFTGENSARHPSRNSGNRWKKTAIEAMRQSGNAFLPRIEGPGSLKNQIQKTGSYQTRILLDEAETSLSLSRVIARSQPKSICLAVGPEEGWSSSERFILKEEGFQAVRISPHTLRTETAAIAGLGACRAILG